VCLHSSPYDGNRWWDQIKVLQNSEHKDANMQGWQWIAPATVTSCHTPHWPFGHEVHKVGDPLQVLQEEWQGWDCLKTSEWERNIVRLDLWTGPYVAVLEKSSQVTLYLFLSHIEAPGFYISQFLACPHCHHEDFVPFFFPYILSLATNYQDSQPFSDHECGILQNSLKYSRTYLN
jgi:hypothetical protein